MFDDAKEFGPGSCPADCTSLAKIKRNLSTPLRGYRLLARLPRSKELTITHNSGVQRQCLQLLRKAAQVIRANLQELQVLEGFFRCTAP